MTFAWLFFVPELLDLGIRINRIYFKLVRNFAKGMVRSFSIALIHGQPQHLGLKQDPRTPN